MVSRQAMVASQAPRQRIHINNNFFLADDRAVVIHTVPPNEEPE